MALVPQKLDNGFTAYQAKAPETPNAAPARKLGDFGYNLNQMGKEVSNLAQLTQSAFRMENDVVNAFDLMTRPTYKYDAEFKVAEQLKKDGLWDDYSDNFIGVGSQEEYDVIRGRIQQEEKDRAVLGAAGMGGVLMQMVAGLVSPTALLPFVGQARGARAVAMGAGMGFAGGLAQEVPLQLAQETRSMEESVSSVALSAVIGGVLGGAVAYARRTPKELADEMIGRGDMASAPGSQAIPSARSAGAQAVDRNVELADSFGLNETVGQMSPVVRVLSSGLDQGRFMMAQLADAGLEFAGNKVAAIGGNVENRIKTHYGPVAKVLTDLDSAYAKYWFGDTEGAKPFAVMRANLAGLNPNRVKMSRQEFKEAISVALQNGDLSDIPEVQQIAQALRKEVYNPLLKQAQEVGMLKTKDGKELAPGDLTYLNRMYNTDLIKMRQPEFEALLANHYEQKVTADFQKAWQSMQESARRNALQVEDFGRAPDEIKELREQFERQLREIDEGMSEELREIESAITDRRAAGRSAPSGSAERAAANEEARALNEAGGEALSQTRAQRAEIKRRLKNLRNAEANLTAKQQAKLDKIDRAEELSFGTLQRLVRQGQKTLADFDKLSDAKLDEQLSKLKNQFADAAAKYDKNEERIAEIFNDEFEADMPTSPFAQAARVESEAFEKMSEVAEAIERTEAFDRDWARTVIQAGLDTATRRAQAIVERRAVRNARLAEQAEQLDPAAAATRLDELRAGQKLKEQTMLDEWRERGADHIDPITGAVDFKRFSGEMARATTNKILRTYQRLPGVDMLMEPRGAELARTLDIDSNLLRSGDGTSFLEMDSEKLMMAYVRTMAPDIELHRAFGDYAPDIELNENWKKLDEEYNAKISNETQLMQAGTDPKTGKPKAYTQEQIDKRIAKMRKEYDDVRRDLQAVIGRMRHTWGIPNDPAGFGARAARVASNVNVLRMMGGVAISSIPDLARPIQKHGLLRTFRDGYVPLIKGLAQGNLTARQLRVAGAALDVVLHSRAAQIYDVGDYMIRGSKMEKGLDYATSKMGLIAVFDYWTTAMKQVSGSLANARAMNAIDVIAGGAKANAKDLEEATRFLAANGIDDDYALRIWNELQRPGASERVNGQLWPNTDQWADPEAVRAYNALLTREVDNTIITPGAERPLMTDANPYQKLLFQFKSFGMSSTTKTFLAGAQGLKQGDMAVVTGGLISLALGTLSYYTYANVVGGKVKETMEAALASGDYGVFADEAINRSGLLGIGADIQSGLVAAGVPYTNFSGQRSTRRGGDNLWETTAGPTVGDLGPRVANVAAGAATAAESGKAGDMAWGDIRRLSPLQNHSLIRYFYDLIEQAGKSLPKSETR